VKLVVLATDSSSTWMLVNALNEDYPDLHVAIENPISRLVLLKKRMVRIGVVKVIGQVLFMLYLPLLGRLSAKRIQSLVASAGLQTKPPTGVFVARFDSVNSQACREWLHNEQPTVVVLNGTRIVSPALLASCNAIFLNTHCGITPAYRGVHGGYWALVRGDKNNVGVTVHLVDAGVDTGSIVFQKTIKIDEQDNFLTYPVKQYIAGIPLMRCAIANVISGNLRTHRRNDLPSAIWHHPTLWHYLWACLRHGVH
jgi:folate-dependent phosphoribosylglycinamide formyltransferase PurN